MKMLRRLMSLLALVACLGFLTACPKQPARVNILIAAASNANPDPAGRGLSVVVQIYQLKDRGRFETADYGAILKKDRETLSDDYLDSQERVLQPGDQKVLEFSANPMAAYIGVAAMFRSPSGDSWRAIIPIKGKKPKFAVNLRENSIELTSLAK